MIKQKYSNRKITHYDEYPLFLQHFLNYQGAIKNYSIETVKSYANDLEIFLKFMVVFKSNDETKNFYDLSDVNIWCLEDEFVKSIAYTDIMEYVYYLHNVRENQANTRYRRIEAVKSFFKYLQKHEQIIDENPAQDIDTPKIEQTVPKYLTVEQCIKLLTNIKSSEYERDYCIITMFLNCGIRLSELVGIDITDITSENTLKIRGKGKKERGINLNKACQIAIQNYKKVRINSSHPIIDKNALFISSRTGKRLKQRRIQQIVETSFESAGLKGYGFSTHKLRHTAATLLFQNGVPVNVIQEVLGHENLSTTEIYTHISNDQLEKAVNANPLSDFTDERSS